MRLDGRTKATVEEGITLNEVEGGVRVVEYQPGNGTRYIVTLAKLPEKACRRVGCQEGSYRVSVEYGGSMYLAPEGYLAPYYVEEKLKCGKADAAVLTELFAHLTGRKAPSGSSLAG